MTDRIELSIIIVNYNGGDYVLDCLSAINNNADLSHEVIIVDNNSTDGSLEKINELYPQHKIIRNSKNLGFAAGNNIGAQFARASILLLLNNDAIIKTALSPAVNHLEKESDTGVLGGLLRHHDGQVQYSIGFIHTPAVMILSWLVIKPISKYITRFKMFDDDPEHYKYAQLGVDCVAGAFFFVKKELWDLVGGLDEAYFMYVEDADFCRKALSAGFTTDFLPSVQALHLEGGGGPWIGQRALLNTIDSYIVHLQKFHPEFPEMLFRICMSLVMSLRSIVYLVLSIGSRRKIYQSKARAFLRAARYCFHKVTYPGKPAKI